MENSLLYHLPIDPMLLIVGFSVLSVVLLIAVIVWQHSNAIINAARATERIAKQARPTLAETA